MNLFWPSTSTFFFSIRRRHTRWPRDWSSDVCSSDLLVSTATKENLRELSFAIARVVAQARAAVPEETRQRIVIRPRAVDEQEFEIRKKGGRDNVWFEVHGNKPRRWVNQTDFSKEEAVG